MFIRISTSAEADAILVVPAGHTPGTGAVGGDGGSRYPAVLLLHGFQGRKEWHVGTAERLARAGVVCMCLDLLPLASRLLERRLELRALNVVHITAAWTRLSGLAQVDDERMCLAGHSAGGALALETACALLEQNHASLPRAVLLLDAVPWLSTLRRVDTQAHRFASLSPSGLEAGLPSRHDVVLVASIRGAPGAWNAHGLVLEVIARGLRASADAGNAADGGFDILVRRAGHGDFLSPAGGRFSWATALLLKALWLTSDTATQDAVQDLAVACVESALSVAPRALADACMAHASAVDARECPSRAVKDMRQGLPVFLR